LVEPLAQALTSGSFQMLFCGSAHWSTKPSERHLSCHFALSTTSSKPAVNQSSLTDTPSMPLQHERRRIGEHAGTSTAGCAAAARAATTATRAGVAARGCHST